MVSQLARKLKEINVNKNKYQEKTKLCEDFLEFLFKGSWHILDFYGDRNERNQVEVKKAHQIEQTK